MKRTVLALALVAGGYLAGQVAPASAYTEPQNMNRLVQEVRGIRAELAKISRKMR